MSLSLIHCVFLPDATNDSFGVVFMPGSGGRGTLVRNGRACLSENLNQTPKGGQSGRGSSFF